MSVFKGNVEDPATHPKFNLTINVSLFSPRKFLTAMGRALPISVSDISGYSFSKRESRSMEEQIRGMLEGFKK